MQHDIIDSVDILSVLIELIVFLFGAARFIFCAAPRRLLLRCGVDVDFSGPLGFLDHV
jgi:hypothetical protein